MEVNYRIVEEITSNGEWEAVGVIVYWPEDPAHLQLRGMLQHTVSRSIWRKIRQRAAGNHLTLATYHEAIEEYSSNYRILPEILDLTAATAAEIRQRLQRQYIFLEESTAVPS